MSKNSKYLEGLLNKFKRATDIYVQSVALETLSWMTTMTVQDSGNAASNWFLSVGGENFGPFDFKGQGINPAVGGWDESRRTVGSISDSDTLRGLRGDAALAPRQVAELARAQMTRIVMNDDYSYPPIAVVNSIDELGRGYETYSPNAFPKVLGRMTEAQTFGQERGLQVAKTKQVVKNVTS